MKEHVIVKTKYHFRLLKFRCSLVLRIIIPAIFLMSNAFAQDIGVSGKVTSPNGESVPGAKIIVKGTAIGTVTDMDGNFKIIVPEAYKDSTLLISSIGFKSKQIKINSQSTINASLEEDAKMLSEVVVVGYGTQKRSDLTGAISSVTSEEIEKATVMKVDQALQGRAAGVQVTQNSGAPNSSVSIRIRGVGTVGNSDPLYVVDGFPMNDINFLNPNDIASIDVLKDASASAIYGARAANGVVIITTKKGKDGKTTITYDTYVGQQEAWKKMDMMDAQTWVQAFNKARANDGKSVQKGFENPASFGAGTNWQDQIFRKATMHNHQLSMMGGNEKNTFALSGSYTGQDGIIVKSEAQRLSFRLNADHKVNSKLKIGENINLSHSSNNVIPENDEYNSPVILALRIDPATPVRIADGSNFAHSKYANIRNPAALLDQTNNAWKTHRAVGGLFGEYEIVKGLKFKTSGGVDLSFVNNYQFNPTYDMAPNEQNLHNTVIRETQMYTSALWENTLAYATTISQKHAVDAMAGYTFQDNTYDNTYATKNDVPTNDSSARYFDAATAISGVVWGGANEWAIRSYLGRINYAFDGKYLLTANLRIDQSSRFIGSNRTGVFPSLSAGWKISKEDFMRELPLISNLKLRAGWGQIGNQNIGGSYPYATLISPGQSYTFGTSQTKINGNAALSGGNPDIKWETVTQTNIGLDIGLWEDRISLSADYYIKNTSDMIVQLPIPLYTGQVNPPNVNGGSVENTGLELSGMYRKSEGEFQYSAGGNISFVKNKVLSLGEGGKAIYTADFRGMGPVSKTDVNEPIASFYGYQTDGIFQNDAEVLAGVQPKAKPGDIRFKDTNGDGKIDQTDRVYIGSPIPKFTYGFNLGASYKGFDMSIFFQGSEGNKIFNGNKFFLEGGNGLTNMSNTMLNAWTPENPNTTIPRLTQNNPNDNTRVSDRYVEDGSYLRLKNLQLGYTLPIGMMNRMRIQKIRIYLSAQNLITFTNYTGFDPEIGIRGGNSLDIGIDRGIYPQARIYSIGANFSF